MHLGYLVESRLPSKPLNLSTRISTLRWLNRFSTPLSDRGGVYFLTTRANFVGKFRATCIQSKFYFNEPVSRRHPAHTRLRWISKCSTFYEIVSLAGERLFTRTTNLKVQTSRLHRRKLAIRVCFFMFATRLRSQLCTNCDQTIIFI